ncbi:MAG: superoxide dismutase, partial [Roseovarius sp.]|uniref:superoxide dismutase n=1 Tax=Roseovarius sp. TaxID=1486281 RepID=UPI001B4E997D
KKEEQLLAMQGEMSQAANRAFRQLLDADMKFGVVKDTDGSLKVTKTENGVNPLCFGQTALLGCDVWEHSYYIDFRNKRPAYLTNFLDNLVNWENVASRM